MFLRKLNKQFFFNCFKINLNYYHFKQNNILNKNKLNSIYEENVNKIILISNGKEFCTKSSEVSSSTNDDDDDHFTTELDLVDQPKFEFRNLLYSKEVYENDKIFVALNECQTTSEVFQHFDRHKNVYTAQLFTQAVILVWNLEKIPSPNETIINDSNTKNIQSINQNMFQFLNKLNNFINLMSADEIICTYLYLSKIGIDKNHEALQNLLFRALDLINDDNIEIPLTALSRLVVAVNLNRDFYPVIICKNIVPRLDDYITSCSTADELRLITITLQNLNQLVTDSIYKRFKDKIQYFLDEKILTEIDVKPILKILNYLTYPPRSNENSILIRNLILTLANKIETLNINELEIFCKVFQNQLEPANCLPAIRKATAALFQETDNPEILAYAAQFISPKQRLLLTKSIRRKFNESYEKSPRSTLPAFYKILRSLKISNFKLCDLYWSKVVEQIKINSQEREIYRIFVQCHRYQYFNNNLGGTYRNKKFEEFISSILMTEFQEGLSKIIPATFSKLASFIIAYGYKNEIPERIVKKIEDLEKQFTIFDCLQLSRGYQIALEMRYRNSNLPPETAMQFFKMETVLNNCAKRHFQAENLNLNELNLIVRSLNFRKVPCKSDIFQRAMEYYRNEKLNLSSRSIREITFNLNSSNYFIPEIFDQISKYIVRNKDYILGDTIEKILYCAYNVGYSPPDDENEFLYWSAEIIKRDFDYMSSLSIVQACLALCFYRSMTDELTNKVFNVDFIRRIEKEIEVCYSKETYPERVLNQVMQLNRSICLDFPHTQIPWFQQNYIEAQLSKLPSVKTTFNNEIKSLLLNIVKDKSCIQTDFITPYGYRIDFVLHLDKHMKPMQILEEQSLNKITKFAILLLKLNSFMENEPLRLRGSEQLRIRHLEMLGYQVLYINVDQWSTINLGMPNAKIDYLKKLLTIK